MRLATSDMRGERHAFWSLTMHELPSSLLVANPINRYLINSPMSPDLKRDADGGLTPLIQHGSPGKDKESNWLPAPKGPFIVFMRLYSPKQEALDGTGKQPPMQRGPVGRRSKRFSFGRRAVAFGEVRSRSTGDGRQFRPALAWNASPEGRYGSMYYLKTVHPIDSHALGR